MFSTQKCLLTDAASYQPCPTLFNHLLWTDSRSALLGSVSFSKLIQFGDEQKREHERRFKNSSHGGGVGFPLHPVGPGTCLAASVSTQTVLDVKRPPLQWRSSARTTKPHDVLFCGHAHCIPVFLFGGHAHYTPVFLFVATPTARRVPFLWPRLLHPCVTWLCCVPFLWSRPLHPCCLQSYRKYDLYGNVPEIPSRNLNCKSRQADQNKTLFKRT